MGIKKGSAFWMAEVQMTCFLNASEWKWKKNGLIQEERGNVNWTQAKRESSLHTALRIRKELMSLHGYTSNAMSNARTAVRRKREIMVHGPGSKALPEGADLFKVTSLLWETGPRGWDFLFFQGSVAVCRNPCMAGQCPLFLFPCLSSNTRDHRDTYEFT